MRKCSHCQEKKDESVFLHKVKCLECNRDICDFCFNFTDICANHPSIHCCERCK